MKKILVLVALAGTLIPAFFVLSEAGGLGNWQGVLPAGQVDSLYYYARMRDVRDGYPLIGNPYLYEYRNTFTPGFFLPDIVSALPALIGIPLDVAVAVNMFFWSLVFLLLSFTLLRNLGSPPLWALGGSVLSYIMAFSYIIRPTSLQIIYPVFLAFLIVLLKFIEEPLNRKRIIYLSLVTALSFYAYILLAYIFGIVLGCVFLWFLFKKRFQEIRALITSLLLTVLLVVPFGIYSYIQMGDPYYAETYVRMGLIHTHLPSFEVFYYGRWIAIGLTALWLLWFSFPRREKGIESSIVWTVSGIGLFSGLVLNIITGIDVSLAIHTGRFIFVWMTLILSVLIYQWFISKAESTKTKALRYVAAGLLVILSIGVVRNIPPGPSFFSFNKSNYFANTQSYAGPLNWLEENVRDESVIWANDSLSAYIPIMTRHYVLFHESAMFHQMPGEELQERYLLAESLDTLSMEELKGEQRLYTGLGSDLEPFVQNKRVWFCNLWARIRSGKVCPPLTDPVAFRGEEYFETMWERFDPIKKNQAGLLKKYRVSYLILDRQSDKIEAKNVTKHELLYDDGRFVVLSLPL